MINKSAFNEKLFGIKDSAAYLGCSVDYVRRAIRDDRLPCVAYGPRTRFVLQSDLSKFAQDSVKQ